jgi:hypothetical protein
MPPPEQQIPIRPGSGSKTGFRALTGGASCSQRRYQRQRWRCGAASFHRATAGTCPTRPGVLPFELRGRSLTDHHQPTTTKRRHQISHPRGKCKARDADLTYRFAAQLAGVRHGSPEKRQGGTHAWHRQAASRVDFCRRRGLSRPSDIHTSRVLSPRSLRRKPVPESLRDTYSAGAMSCLETWPHIHQER